MNKNNQKQAYSTPEIECIALDKDISLQLASELPPFGPGELVSLTHEYLKNDPFNTPLA